MELRTKGLQAVVVSLANNQVHIYKDKYIVSKFVTQDLVIGVKFGRFGREEANLLLSTKSQFQFFFVEERSTNENI